MAMASTTKVVATVGSMNPKTPEKAYEIRMNENGRWCTCPAYRFQSGPWHGRSCKHLVAFEAKLAKE